MKGLTGQSRHLVHVILGVLTLIAVILLALAGQAAGALLLPLAVGLAAAVAEMRARARALARQLADGDSLEKLEVPGGPWGELTRAVNGLLQERRRHARLDAVLPAPLPAPIAQAILEGRHRDATPQPVAVLLLTCATSSPALPADPLDMQALAALADELARHHGALLQPSGDAMMLVFGAFTEQPGEVALHTARAAAESIQRTWRANGRPPLAISLTSGLARLVPLPGIGLRAVGAPVSQALQIGQLAAGEPRYRLLCSEHAYLALGRASGGWERTGLRAGADAGRAQPVYGLSG